MEMFSVLWIQVKWVKNFLAFKWRGFLKIIFFIVLINHLYKFKLNFTIFKVTLLLVQKNLTSFLFTCVGCKCKKRSTIYKVKVLSKDYICHIAFFCWLIFLIFAFSYPICSYVFFFFTIFWSISFIYNASML